MLVLKNGRDAYGGKEMMQTGDEKKESYRKMLEIMGCPCQVIDRRGAEQPLEELYLEKREQGKRDGFVPLFIYPDENFIDMVTTNLAESSMEMPESLLGRFEDGEAAEHFQEDTDYLTRQKSDVILAEIPVDQPWKVLGWLPFGGWNQCPDSGRMLAFAKRWYEMWGAVPAVMGADTLQFYVDTPVADQEQAEKLAMEQFGFCFTEEVMTLAGSLSRSHVWFFWWD